jgi:hypothetical protein
MVTYFIIAAYGAIGVIAAISVVARGARVASVKGAPSFVLMLIFWPFFLPTSLLADADVPRAAIAISGPKKRIAEVGANVRDAWTKSGPVDQRERMVVESFLARLDERATRAEELRATLAIAAPSIRTRLEQLRADADREIEEGLLLLEEMAAQLTLLRFTGRSDLPSADRDQVEGLLGRIEAMANV